MKNKSLKIPIKNWPEKDRPREKLLSKGRDVLSDAELIAIIIGSGNSDESAVTLSMRILQSVDNDLNLLSKISVKTLQKFYGIGEAKAISIIAAVELGRRRQHFIIKETPQIQTSKDGYCLLCSHFSDLPHEEFWIIYLNKSNKMITKERVSIGGVGGTVADPKIVFKQAIECLASGIILAHNHPSGNLKPSLADIELTRKMKQLGNLMEISVLDHLIFAGQNYFSFADEGIL